MHVPMNAVRCDTVFDQGKFVLNSCFRGRAASNKLRHSSFSPSRTHTHTHTHISVLATPTLAKIPRFVPKLIGIRTERGRCSVHFLNCRQIVIKCAFRYKPDKRSSSPALVTNKEIPSKLIIPAISANQWFGIMRAQAMLRSSAKFLWTDSAILQPVFFSPR